MCMPRPSVSKPLGLPRVWWADSPDTGKGAFSYHATPYGFFIELVDTAARAFYPDWFRAVDPALTGGDGG